MRCYIVRRARYALNVWCFRSRIHVDVTMLTVSCLRNNAVRKLHYIPPWAILGSMVTAIGSGLMVTFEKDTSEGKWIGYQILAGFGRGTALNMVRSLFPLFALFPYKAPACFQGLTPAIYLARHRGPGGPCG